MLWRNVTCLNVGWQGRLVLDSQWKTPQAQQSWGVLSFQSAACGACASLCFMLAAQWASHSLEPPASWDLHDVMGITFTALHSSPWGLLCRKSDPYTYYQVSVAVWNLGASLSVLHLSCLQSPGHLQSHCHIHDTAFVLLPGPGSCHFTAHSRWLLPTLGAPSWLTLGGCFSVASGSQDKFT